MINPPLKQIYRFEDVELDLSRGSLRRGGQELHLRQKTFQVLLYLIEEHERLVTKEELMERLWRDVAVTDDALAQCIMDIRRALGDDSRNPRFIKTVPKFGYRFIAPIEEARDAESALVARTETEEITSVQIDYEEDDARPAPFVEVTSEAALALPPRPRFGKRVALACAVALVMIAAITVVLRNRWRAQQPEEHVATTLPHVAGKRALAVMHFENLSGDVDLNWLREGLTDMLVTNLSRSQRLVALSREQLHLLLERTGHRPGEKVTFERSLEVARKSRADMMVMGSFARLGGKVRIDARLHDAATGQLIAAESLTADGLDAVLPQVDLLSLKIAAHMGVEPDGQQTDRGLAGVMTTNLDAYRYYSLALEQAQMQQLPEAIELLRKAVVLDPQFAMAHARIGYVYAVKWHLFDQAGPHLEKAFQLADRLTKKDRLYIAAWDAVARQDAERAVQSYRDIIASYPLEVETYQSLGRLLYKLKRLDEAVSVVEQGLVVNPEAEDLFNTLGHVYMWMGRQEEALAAYNRYIQLVPRDPNSYDSLGLFHQWFGRYDEAARAYERALALNPESPVAIIHLGNLYFHRGRYQAAIGQYRRYAQLAPNVADQERGYDAVAFVYLQKRDLKRADEALRPVTKWDYLPGSALRLAFARNDMAGVEKWKRHLLKRMGRRGHEIGGYLRGYFCHLGYIALREGHAEEAIQNFKEALKHLPHYWHYDSFESCLADAYLKLGMADEAIAEYERILRLNPNYPLAHYHLAQAFDRKGRSGQARAHYERFLQVWETADTDIPQVMEAKKRLSQS